MNEPTPQRPWYRHFWPWFLIVITGSAVIGGITTLIIAINHPETMVVSDAEYRSLQADFRPDPAGDGASEDGGPDDGAPEDDGDP